MYKALNDWVLGGFEGKMDVFDMIHFAARKKLDGLELTFGSSLPFTTTQGDCCGYRACATANKVKFRTLATGFYLSKSLSAADEKERCEAIALTQQYLQVASWMQVESILVVPGTTCVPWDPSRPVVSYKTAWENSVKSINALIPHAERLGINLALENIWGRFLLSPMEWKFFLDQFQSERVGMYLDIGNCAIFGRAEDYIEILGDKIKAVHIKNFAGSDCAGGLHGFGDDLLQGDVDFKSIAAALKKIKFKGPLTAEMIPFCRLPDMILPDLKLAEETADKLKSLSF